MEIDTITSLREVVARFTQLLDAQNGDVDDAALAESINVGTVCRTMVEVPIFADLAPTDVHHFISVVGVAESCDAMTAACIYRACYAAYRAHPSYVDVEHRDVKGSRMMRATDGRENIHLAVYDKTSTSAANVHSPRKAEEYREEETPPLLRVQTPEGSDGADKEEDKDEGRGKSTAVSAKCLEYQTATDKDDDDDHDNDDDVTKCEREFKREIFEFYRRYAAHRLRKNGVNIPHIAEKYAGKRDLLNKRLKNIYGTNLDTMAMRRSASSTNAHIDIMERLQLWSME